MTQRGHDDLPAGAGARQDLEDASHFEWPTVRTFLPAPTREALRAEVLRLCGG